MNRNYHMCIIRSVLLILLLGGDTLAPPNSWHRNLVPFSGCLVVSDARTTSLRREKKEVDGELAHKKEKAKTMRDMLSRAGKRGLQGGVPGAMAGVIQVLVLMWLRTITNYQSRYGTTFAQAMSILMKEGGIRRLYRGLNFAIIQAPLTRFVSTFANDSVQTFLAALQSTRTWGPERTTLVASVVVGLCRVLLMPVDTMKVVLQVDGAEGFRSLMRRLKMGRLEVLYEGALATAIMASVGHYPWFLTYNFLSTREWLASAVSSKLLRNGLIGFLASIVSDTVTNSLKVVKTMKQATGSKSSSTYSDIIRMIVAADGWKGLFGRGLRTRIMTNALQSILFTVAWRGFAEALKRRRNNSSKDEQAEQRAG